MPPSPLPARHPRLLSHLLRAQSHTASSYNYTLPTSHIALRPLRDRASSNLLVVHPHSPPRHLSFRDLPALLPPHTLLLLNSSRVVPTRVPMRNLATGAPAELMLLHPSPHADAAAALRRPAHAQVWRAYIRGKKVRAQDRLVLRAGDALAAHVLARERQAATVRLELPAARRAAQGASLADVLAQVGETPLPPYLKREATPEDAEAYQTVYASTAGSAAAPTAGLHMTDRLMERLRERGVQMEDVVLHVGAGTFAPLTAETVGGHDMHAEQISFPRACVEKVGGHVESRRPIVAMGTTSVRALESMYWFGVRLLVEEGAGARGTIHVGQWEPYERMDELGEDALPTPHQAIQAVLQWHRGRDAPMFGTTQLLVVPEYPFKMVDAIITNFHQPRSTLLMLVSAFLGGTPQDLFGVYQEALDRGYRFLSYGDSSIFVRPSFFER